MAVEQPATNFLDLPPELLTQILSYVVPSGYRFKFDDRQKRSWGSPEPVFDNDPACSSSSSSEPWNPIVRASRMDFRLRTGLPYIDMIDHVGELDIIPFLLLHRSLHAIVQEIIYRSNKFWFLDLFSLQSFTAQISTPARYAVRNLTIHVCGMVSTKPNCIWTMYEFEHRPDLRFAKALSKFPGLRQVRLHGIGPGVIRSIDGTASGQWIDQCIWTVPCLDLVRRIIGVDGRSSELEPGHALLNGKVVCRKMRTMERGRMRIFGTWIVRRGLDDPLGKVKEEIDVCVAYERAKHFEMECQMGKEAMERRRTRREERSRQQESVLEAISVDTRTDSEADIYHSY